MSEIAKETYSGPAIDLLVLIVFDSEAATEITLPNLKQLFHSIL